MTTAAASTEIIDDIAPTEPGMLEKMDKKWIIGFIAALVIAAAAAGIWWWMWGRFGDYKAELAVKPMAERDEAASKELRLLAKARYQTAEGRSGEAAAAMYREALGYFQKAYALFPDAILLYSIGSCHRELYRLTEDEVERRIAIHRYEQYIDEEPDGEWADEAEAFIDGLNE